MESALEWNDEVREGVLKRLKLWQQCSKKPAAALVTELVEHLNTLGIALPSPELGELLVSQTCFDNNHPWMWKFTHHALSSRLLFPLQILSLLASNAIPHRHSHPHSFALFLPLLSQYAFSFHPTPSLSCNRKIVSSVDSALRISEIYKVRDLEIGHVFVLFFYEIVISLLDCMLIDWGFQVTFSEKSSLVAAGKGEDCMDIDRNVTQNFEKSEYREQIRKRNSFTALEVLERLTESRKATILLQSVLLNISKCNPIDHGKTRPEKFNCLQQRLQFLESLELASSELKLVNQVLTKVSANMRGVSHFDYSLSKHRLVGTLINMGSCKIPLKCNYRFCQSPCWVPFDIYMENAMDSRQIATKSAIDVLTEGIKTLQMLNQASWQETFLALWLSALRLVQRERDPPEGPIPHLVARLCVLLCIVPLAIANVLRDASEHNLSSLQASMESEYTHETKSDDSVKRELMSSVQVLGHFSGLLCPPTLVIDAANQAARKAASFIYNSMNAKGESGTGIHANANTKAGEFFGTRSFTSMIPSCNLCGNLRHLIVEACIARNLMDTSVYFWPGYVSTSVLSLSDSSPPEKSPWSMFMEGTPLNNTLINSLTMTPASSLAEIEKLYYIALNGSDVERPAAAKILCGASLGHGWYIQEHVIHHVIKLLASPLPPSHAGSRSLLVDNMPMLCAVLRGASSVDTVHILSLHGVVPTVAAALLPLCEAFGSIKPTSNSTGDESSTTYMAFSLAFLFLIRLWKFCRPPLDLCITELGVAVGGLEYILSLHNHRVMYSQDKRKSNPNLPESASVKPVYIDSFPKLRALYCQYKSCLRDLVDFLPASLAAIIDYFSSEVTRGVWKLVPMNGTDWPSPAALLPSIELEIKAILTHVGVEVPNCSSGMEDATSKHKWRIKVDVYLCEITRLFIRSRIVCLVNPSHLVQLGGSPVMLPLPMAALVSLSITFKLDKSLEYMHAITGAALENCASGCPWPSMPIIGSLWAQKVRRWHNFIVVSGSRSVFRQNNESVAQLLRSCFTSFLGTLSVSTSKLTSECGVNGLLGSTITAPGAYPYVSPGFLFLRSCRNIHNVQYVNDIIVGLVTEYSNELAGRRSDAGSRHIKSNESSLSLAAQSAKEVATLGASLLCAAGGMLLVQELYKETIPTWLLSSRDVKKNNDSVASYILEGYAMAYLLILSGSIIWGVGTKLPPGTFSRRSRTIEVHLDFLAEVMEKKISVSCNPITWKTYVCCFVGFMVSLAPVWIQEVRVDTLKKLALGLSRWNEHEIALSLLHRGGLAAMGALAELVTVIESERMLPSSLSNLY
ncbi:Mediator of RNA polymerase II transcription subunit 33A REF4-related 1 protein [Vigna angularis]|uniref:Mediator of RNA polymerase II transcription subunit 33A REF4-related 1 protein n=1 Tax=Phaseolus angularis TaxID=3914 RepID=A0A8T0KVX3_PHAAN|nr:Mediator of RNA polymerase II transcription subunit 33A REF4-related 1 protein [Vigna angularis]